MKSLLVVCLLFGGLAIFSESDAAISTIEKSEIYGAERCTAPRTEDINCPQVQGHEDTCTKTYKALKSGNPGETLDHKINKQTLEMCGEPESCGHAVVPIPHEYCENHVPPVPEVEFH